MIKKQPIHILVALIVLFPIISFFNPSAIIAAENSEKAILFSWTIFYKPVAGPTKPVHLKELPILSAGDQLQLFINSQSSCYIYIFLIDSRHNTSVIFPSNFSTTAPYIVKGTQYYIPSPDAWFEVDHNTGVEKFYFLAFHNRPENLETIASQLLYKPTNKELQAQVMEEIKKIKRKYSSFANRGEKGVSIAGTIKTRALHPKNNAIQVETSNFYGKTIRFQHE